MARRCEVCGRGAVSGNKVADRKGVRHYITGKTRRTFRVNLHKKVLVIDGARRRLRICTRCLRTFTEKGTLPI